jgi:hypothetical protein
MKEIAITGKYTGPHAWDPSSQKVVHKVAKLFEYFPSVQKLLHFLNMTNKHMLYYVGKEHEFACFDTVQAEKLQKQNFTYLGFFIHPLEFIMDSSLRVMSQVHCILSKIYFANMPKNDSVI